MRIPVFGSLVAILQLFFALTWIVYVIYLPALAEQAGLERRYVPMILMMDQVIFLACDWFAGVYADRAARMVGRIGGTMAVAALVSCAAFIALPWVAPAAGAFALLLLTALWSATSSALRAPPFAIVARHVPAGQQPWTTSLYLLGLGLASAAGPYLGLALKGVDPRIPFAAASLGLAAFVCALAAAERRSQAAVAPPPPSAATQAGGGTMVAFALALFLLALGFQVHFSINSAPSYLRFARPEELPKLMPIFWIGFNLAILPAGWLRRFGGARVMAVAGLAGVVALIASARAPGIDALMAAQLVAGAAWAVALATALTIALEAGHPGREGLFTGVLFSAMAAAAFARVALGASQVPANSLVDVPVAAWLAGSLLAAAVARLARR